MLDVVVLGGGLAGVLYGLEFKVTHPAVNIAILERQEITGGLLRSETIRDHVFDVGGSHIIFSRNRVVLDRMLEILNSSTYELLRKSFVMISHNLIPYPLENNLNMLPQEDRIDALISFLEAWDARRDRIPKNLSEWIYSFFGKWIAERYLVPYNLKIWKRPLEEIDVDWVYTLGRLPIPDWRDVVRSAMGQPTIGYKEQFKFYYPRLRPLTFTGPKQLVPVANKPISQYVLEDLVSAGVKDIAIVLGETYPELVKEHYGDGSKFGAKITYIYQGKPLGIAHAVALCREFAGEDKFIVYLGDNLLQHGIKPYLEKFLSGELDAMVLLKEVRDPMSFGVAKFDERGNLIGLVEKPKKPPSNYALVGVYFLTPVFFEVAKDLKPSWRGELEITDALQMMIDRKLKVSYEVVRGWWIDTGKKDDILEANALILDERIERDIQGEIINSRIEGRVNIEKGAKIVNSVVRGPTIIGENSKVEGSFIGPYTSIGKNAHIKDSSIEYSVILDGAEITGVERLEESLIGRNTKIKRGEGRKIIKLHVGDYSEINL